MALASRSRFAERRYLLRPCGLAGSRWEPAAAGLCSVALGSVFVLDFMTPDDVLASLGLPPLLAAVWSLSGRVAAAISMFALGLFGVVLAREPGNRLTIVCIGVAGVLLAAAARLYATSLAGMLPGRGITHAASLPPAPTRAAVDRWGKGLESLTRREAEVARLAGQGYMASEIGDRLKISARTVESHLAHAYAKLGINSRRALIQMGADPDHPR